MQEKKNSKDNKSCHNKKLRDGSGNTNTHCLVERAPESRMGGYDMAGDHRAARVSFETRNFNLLDTLNSVAGGCTNVWVLSVTTGDAAALKGSRTDGLQF
jgi:hypothetical protein